MHESHACEHDDVCEVGMFALAYLLKFITYTHILQTTRVIATSIILVSTRLYYNEIMKTVPRLLDTFTPNHYTLTLDLADAAENFFWHGGYFWRIDGRGNFAPRQRFDDSIRYY